MKIYITSIVFLSFIISILISCKITGNNVVKFVAFLSLLCPASEFVIQIIQYILNKLVKPKLIPKMNFEYGIPKEEATFVIVPTIVDSAKKVKEIFKNLEVDYLANKSENLYFCLLGDCKQSKKQFESYDDEVQMAGIKEAQRLNSKYEDLNFPKFHFIYRKRVWNEGEEAYLGWERKRGAITDFVECLLMNLNNQEIQSL